MKIEFTDIHKKFDQVTALEQVSLKIESGELFFLLGPSGCGKTTLLRILAGFEEPDSGTLSFDGINAVGTPAHKRNTAMVFQGYALWPHLTVQENVAFGLQMKRLPKHEIQERVNQALARVQISDLSSRKPNQLSGGQQQRVALARTLVVEPQCLLMDEPLANLDAKLRSDMRTEIRQLCKDSGLTAVYVTHDRKEALSMADRVAVMNQGRILQVGTPREVYTRPDNRFVANFIGESNFIEGVLNRVESNLAVVECKLGQLTSSVQVPTGLKVNDPVLVCFRPEVICINNDDTKQNVFDASVKLATYFGEMAEYTVTASENIDLRIFALNPKSIPHKGEKLKAHVPPEDVVILER